MSLHPAFDWREAARIMLISRILDELEESQLVPQGHINYQFSARGHELGQVLLAQLLTQPLDAAATYYRSRPFILASGYTAEEALASDMARAGSVSGGRDIGVVTHMVSRGRATILPQAADVGSQYTPAAGFAQALRYRVEQLGQAAYASSMAVVFGADGSVASNGFWSALTIATTLSLPLLFVVEDNGYAISVQTPTQTPSGNIASNLSHFAHLAIFDGSGVDPVETAALVADSIAHIRSGAGPALLRLVVPRLSGHSSVDNQAYKSADAIQEEWSRDPIPALRAALVPAVMSQEEWEALVDECVGHIHAAAEAALAQPFAPQEDAATFVFHDPRQPQQMGGLLPEGITLPAGTDTPAPPDMRRINMLEAIRRTLAAELALNPRCTVFGEDVGRKGGVHAVTLGLQEQFGEGRVFDTSLSEEGIIGRAVGMAYAGLMPVPEIQYRKYADPATEHLNNCGTVRWRTNNHVAAPIVVRLAGGYRRIGDPWHSVTSEATFVHQPGWRVAVPSNAEDAVGLLRTALRGSDPVIFFEHRAMLDAAWARRPYPGDDYVLPFGRAHHLLRGDDLTVVTWGGMVERCEAAAQAVSASGASIDLLDLRTLSPWDESAVFESVRKTGKCLIVHEEIIVAGFGAEIAARVAQECFTSLDAPIQRIGAPACPVPFSTTLMEGVIPGQETIRAAMEALLAY